MEKVSSRILRPRFGTLCDLESRCTVLVISGGVRCARKLLPHAARGLAGSKLAARVTAWFDQDRFSDRWTECGLPCAGSRQSETLLKINTGGWAKHDEGAVSVRLSVAKRVARDHFWPWRKGCSPSEASSQGAIKHTLKVLYTIWLPRWMVSFIYSVRFAQCALEPRLPGRSSSSRRYAYGCDGL